MRCTACGGEIPEGTKFCIHCGTPVSMPSAPVAEEKTEEKVNLVLEETPKVDLEQSSFRPEPAAEPAPQKPQTSVHPTHYRDGRGKYILKRLIFFGCALAIWVGFAFILQGAVPRYGDGGYRMDIFPRLLQTLFLMVGPIIISFIISMLVGLVRGAKAKSVIRIISAVLRAMVPASLGVLLIYLLAYKAGWFPAFGMGSIESMVLPFLTMLIPMTGYLMNAAVSNGRKPGFAGSVGAVAACLADHMIIIVLSVATLELVFHVPGACQTIIQMIYQYNFGSTFVLTAIGLGVLTYLLKLINDVIAALCSGGDPAEQVYGMKEPGEKNGKGLLLVGIIFSAVIVAAAVVIPFFAKESLAVVSTQTNLPAGAEGHILGTDSLGRDLFDILMAGLRNTLLAALINTIIACIIGGIFGLLAGVIRNWAAEIFKGFRYVFGYGAPITLMIFVVLLGYNTMLPLFAAAGMYCWGGIADRVAGVIKVRRQLPLTRTAKAVPILEQVVQTFCTSIICVFFLGFFGLVRRNPAFPSLGQITADLTTMISNNEAMILVAFLVTTLALTGFYLIHAGLSAKERFTFK